MIPSPPICILYSQDADLVRRMKAFLTALAQVRHVTSPDRLDAVLQQNSPAILVLDLRAKEARDLLEQIQMSLKTNVRQFAQCQFRRLHIDIDRLDAAVRIDELIIRRRRLAIHNAHLFAECLENSGHAELTTEGITIRPDVAHQQEPLLRTNDFSKSRPIDGHQKLGIRISL